MQRREMLETEGDGVKPTVTTREVEETFIIPLGRTATALASTHMASLLPYHAPPQRQGKGRKPPLDSPASSANSVPPLLLRHPLQPSGS